MKGDQTEGTPTKKLKSTMDDTTEKNSASQDERPTPQGTPSSKVNTVDAGNVKRKDKNSKTRHRILNPEDVDSPYNLAKPSATGMLRTSVAVKRCDTQQLKNENLTTFVYITSYGI
ncbi:unnamed protein product [Calypogeia fissa]